MSITKNPIPLHNRRTGEQLEVAPGAEISWVNGDAFLQWVYEGETKRIKVSVSSVVRGLGLTEPSIEQLTEWAHDGVCESILGERVEPDGIDEHGSPSWLLAMGMI